jgi:branched-chain amino acid transport system ATP-binding protein
MRLVMKISDRIHVLDGGRTLMSGTAAQVRADPAVIAAYLGSHVEEASHAHG